ncbi:L,D-transpeptidase family protein [Halomonas llamarensis]
MLPGMASAQPDPKANGYYALPVQGDFVGQDYDVIANKDDTLLDIARVHNVGYEEIQAANPDVSLWVPGEGTSVTIPRRHILPDVERKGIVINIAELRLYYYPEAEEGQPPQVATYPIGIGREGYDTPLGITRTTMRLEQPAWYPPSSMRKEAAERGDPPPEVVPPGPDNPLGEYAILLDIPGYLIHGTNQPDGIGMRASRGCIRMYPEDIESVFDEVPTNTQVNIIDHPIKVGEDEQGNTYLQVFKSVEGVESGIEQLEDMLITKGVIEEEGSDILDRVRLLQLLAEPDDQITSLSLFYQDAVEEPDETEAMTVYSMLDEPLSESC